MQLIADQPGTFSDSLVWPFVAGLYFDRGRHRAAYLADYHPGRFFQYRIKVQTGHRAVTDGPYRYVRHPPHSMITLALAGIALACDDVLSLAGRRGPWRRGGAVRIRAE